jgi:cyclic pyranopterin phosphate synthase
LNFEKYAYITQSEDIGLGDVLDGILEAIKVGFSPLKINVVVMRGVNEGEVVDFVKFGMSKGVCVRFIEFMPLNKGIDMYVSNKEVKDRIEKYFKLIPTDFSQGAGPAEYFQVDGSKCKVGFISPRSGNICKNCNRIRLTSDGKLRPCLLSNTEIDLKKALREGKGIEELFSFALRIKTKPYSYNERLNRSMLQIGG